MPQLRAGQHPVDRGQAARGVLGVLSGSSARRGEAHLWLLLEEALTSIRRGGASVDEVQRNVHAVTGALAAAEVVPPGVARRLETEFGNLLAVRGLVPLAGFLASDPETGAEESDNVVETEAPEPPPRNGAAVWLEAEIGRHLDLLAGFDPTTRPSAGSEAMRILAGPVRAFEASRAVDRPGRALIDDFATTLVQVGYEVRRPLSIGGGAGAKRQGRARPEWVAYLGQALPLASSAFEPDTSHDVDVELGDIRPGLSVRLTRLAWTADTLEVVARIVSEGLDVTPRFLRARDVLDLEAQWSCRVVDDGRALHLGQPTLARYEAGGATRFVLRPGLADGTEMVEITVTVGGRSVTGTVEW